MSSAILYVAIVAIWACVLIPRWLRRSPSVDVPAEPEAPASPETVADEGAFPERGMAQSPAEAPRAAAGARAEARRTRPRDPEPLAAPEPEPEEDGWEHPVSLTREESRLRMLAARRRLLILLVALELAAGALPLLGLAALWVEIPPSVTLVGYLLLLREASKADRERERREAEPSQARTLVRSRDSAGPRSRGAAPVPAHAQASPEPEGYEEYEGYEQYEDLGHGRDYAPGLAGKYTTSDAEGVIEYKRAVGD